jgi:hypothetical protein
MTSTRSLFAKRAIPSHIIDSQSSIVDFLEKYLIWSEETGNATADIYDLLKNRDSASAESEYMEFFRKEFLPSIPDDAKADKSLLVRHILDLYKTRGTERSYKFLFSILFNESVKLTYPRDSIFMPSAAKWVIERSVFVKSATSLVGFAFERTFLVTGKRKIEVEVNYAVKAGENLYEIFFRSRRELPAALDSVEINGLTYKVSYTVGISKIVRRG